MNKVLHALVFIILVLAGMAGYYEFNLFQKRSLLSDRNTQLEEAIVSLAKTFEAADAQSKSAPEVLKDVSPCEAKEVDSPETVDLLDGYDMKLEEANLETMDLDKEGNDGRARRLQLRNHLLIVGGAPVEDEVRPGQFKTTGEGTADELIGEIANRAKEQLTRLNNTRRALTEMRERLEKLAKDHNKLKPELRADKITIEEQKAKIAEVQGEKSQLEDRIGKLKSQIDDLNAEVTSLKDEVQQTKDELEAAKEEVETERAKADQLQKMLVEMRQQQTGPVASKGSTSAANFTYGDKGVVEKVDNEMLCAIVKLTDEALTEVLGSDRTRPLPLIDLAILRTNAEGMREMVGKVRMRQWIQGRNYVICDILEEWSQMDMEKGDVVFAE